jgi:hypothetical protein
VPQSWAEWFSLLRVKPFRPTKERCSAATVGPIFRLLKLAISPVLEGDEGAIRELLPKGQWMGNSCGHLCIAGIEAGSTDSVEMT